MRFAQRKSLRRRLPTFERNLRHLHNDGIGCGFGDHLRMRFEPLIAEPRDPCRCQCGELHSPFGSNAAFHFSLGRETCEDERCGVLAFGV